MPEITANTRIILGIISASAAITAGLVGNVLAASVIAFFSGRHKATAKRPALLWLVFLVSAVTTVATGSIATFAPAPREAEKSPKVVITNTNSTFQRVDVKNSLVICRDRIEIANTSDISTSIVSIATELQIDGALVQIDPTEGQASWANDEVAVALAAWTAGPDTTEFKTLRTLEQFASIEGTPLPAKIEARSTTRVDIDFALKFLSGLPERIVATHSLRFPDIKDMNTDPIRCR